MYIQVLVEIANKNIDKTFTYAVPEHLEKQMAVGKRVQVPFGKQILEGFVLEIVGQPPEEYETKEILEVVDEEVILNEELLELGKQLSKRTLSLLISCYQVMLPKALKARNRVEVHKKLEKWIELSCPLEILEERKWNKTQQKILDLLKKEPRISKELLQHVSSSSLKTLLANHIVKEVATEKYRLERSIERKEKYPLTQDQQRVVEEVLQNRDHEVFLLHGVTGSGKTEVYMELIEKMLEEGKTSIVLVPEISLTEQIVSRFESHFGDRIAILHSRLSDGEKYDEWRKIARGEVSIVIGARSAIFAPLKNIGMIIIDEEHTTSYKQDNNPKYSAIEVAKIRGKTHHAPLILGSATPSLESYARSQKGVYHLLELPHRINQKVLPKVEVVDLNQEAKRGNHYFSSLLQEKMRKCLDRNEQVMLLLNRRGYSSMISCKSCGHVEKCPNCDITLTYHKSSRTLRCHYCGYGTKVPEVCPNCQEDSLTNLGTGTEKIEEELTKLFPEKKVVRMDVDTTSKKGSHERIIKDFQEQKYDILLGTQMIAKGLDFANVTLVGVISADTSLNIPDFRSSEYTYQLLSQVAGRSGRGEKEGQVIIQTYNPDHYAIHYAQKHDYCGFYREEMKLRHQLGYPPYFYLVALKIMSKDYDLAREESNKVGTYLKNNLHSTIILGPSIANVFRVNNVYRFQIILKYKKEPALYPTLESLLEHNKMNNKVRIDLDFDPLHF